MRKSEQDYESSMFGTPGGVLVSTIELSAVLHYLKPKDYERILEVGTGTGRIARKIVSFGADVIGIDVNKPRIRRAVIRREGLKDCKHTHELVIADGQFLPFKSSSFDAIVCVRTLKYFPSYRLGVEEMSRVLKLDGRLVLSLSNVLSLDSLLLRIGVLAYRTLFNFRKAKYVFLHNDLVVIDYLGLHKIHPRIWTWFQNSCILDFLRTTELILQKLTPKEFLSREILVKLIKRRRAHDCVKTFT